MKVKDLERGRSKAKGRPLEDPVMKKHCIRRTLSGLPVQCLAVPSQAVADRQLSEGYHCATFFVVWIILAVSCDEISLPAVHRKLSEVSQILICYP